MPQPEHQIQICSEMETPRGWRYAVEIQQAGRRFAFEVALSWAEHDLWSHGRVPPEKVVRAALVFLLRNEPVERIMPKFDCAVIRRYFPQVDAELPKLIGLGGGGWEE